MNICDDLCFDICSNEEIKSIKYTMPVPEDHLVFLSGPCPAPMYLNPKDPRRPKVEAALTRAAKYAFQEATLQGTIKHPDLDYAIEKLIEGMLGNTDLNILEE